MLSADLAHQLSRDTLLIAESSTEAFYTSVIRCCLSVFLTDELDICYDFYSLSAVPFISLESMHREIIFKTKNNFKWKIIPPKIVPGGYYSP